ncbi:MAG: ribose 5-phosphate isomerase B [Candidatus Eisenbacteria bacterium]|uniref:Ribose 5-phosphate isomerase B n=1 Tax=Eiseniibacteriota bacterium TaxID=2212470 RepID=A0A933W7X2_UNCEI|nr:ribose 5-phosphate isomerase B [Candidatus Eisenbacteria bacterium]
MKLAVGSDHAGFPLKELVKAELVKLGHEVVDVGTHSGTESVDYPDFSFAVAEAVAAKTADLGVVVCATGIGASIAANKVVGVRASVVTSDETARLTRQDNDSNVLALGAKTAPSAEDALRWLRVWLDTPFAGGRHERRVNKIRDYESRASHP